MIVKTSKDNYEKITYDFEEKNYSIMNPFIDIDFFHNIASNNKIDTVSDFTEKLINFIKAEKSDWGNKEVYLSFDEIEYLISSTKILHDRYAAGTF